MTLEEKGSPSKPNISSLISVTNAEAKTLEIEQRNSITGGTVGSVTAATATGSGSGSDSNSNNSVSNTGSDSNYTNGNGGEPKLKNELEVDDQSGDFVNGNQPRKRSKVSRACDCCRRKKIKCNAEYSTSLGRVTKTCDNCVKNQEECSFSRVPLKRGPSKGYIRDLEEKLEHSNPKSTMATQLPPPHSISEISKSNHIILPPINGANNKVQLPILNHSPPTTTSTTTDNSIDSPKIQGPFWKVPYEMPSNHHHDLQNDLSRRSSIDSISSSSTTGLRSNLPMKGSIDQNSSVSDSEDDYYSAGSFKQSRRSSASLSPRNSISSLSSLNGRMSKVTFNNSNNSSSYGVPSISPSTSSPNITQQISSFNGSPSMSGASQPFGFHSRSNSHPIMPPVGQQVQPFQQTQQGQQMPGPPGQIPGQMPGPGQIPSQSISGPVPVGGVSKLPNSLPIPVMSNYNSSVNSPSNPPQSFKTPNLNISVIDQNLKVYYSKFHQNFPILPFNETFIYNIFEIYFNNSRQDEKFNMVIDLFNRSLHQLINYQYINLNDSIQLVNNIVSLYPFNNFGIKLENNVYLLFFSSLVLINYAVLLNGSNYSLPLSITLSIFNDYKILESFYDLVDDKPTINSLNFDNLKLYLPKLYYCLVVIDNYFCLSFGINKLTHSSRSSVLAENINYLIPNNSNLVLFKSTNIVNDLIASRNNYRLKQCKDYKMNFDLWNVDDLRVNSYQNLFLKMIKSKYEMTNFLIEISYLFNNPSFNSQANEEKNEILTDYLLKLLRLMKTLTNDILSMVDFIVKVVNKFELIQPILNLTINQIFKLIKLNKVIIDSLLQFVDNEVFSRISRINNDLLNGFNGLTINLNSDSSILSIQSINMLKNRLNNYNLNFQLIHNPGNQLMNWKYEFSKLTMAYVDREDIDGWLN